jgi:hypothetical protein
LPGATKQGLSVEDPFKKPMLSQNVAMISTKVKSSTKMGRSRSRINSFSKTINLNRLDHILHTTSPKSK